MRPNWKRFPTLNWFPRGVSGRVDVISQTDRAGCSKEKIEPSAVSPHYREKKKKRCTHPLLRHTRWLQPYLITALLPLPGDLTYRHPIYAETNHRWTQAMKINGDERMVMPLSARVTTAPLWIPRSRIHLCVLPQIYGADLARSGCWWWWWWGSDGGAGRPPLRNTSLITVQSCRHRG